MRLSPSRPACVMRWNALTIAVLSSKARRTSPASINSFSSTTLFLDGRHCGHRRAAGPRTPPPGAAGQMARLRRLQADPGSVENLVERLDVQRTVAGRVDVGDVAGDRRLAHRSHCDCLAASSKRLTCIGQSPGRLCTDYGVSLAWALRGLRERVSASLVFARQFDDAVGRVTRTHLPPRCSIAGDGAGIRQHATRAAPPTGRYRPRSWRGRWRRERAGTAASPRGRAGRPGRGGAAVLPSDCPAACRWRTGRAPRSARPRRVIGGADALRLRADRTGPLTACRRLRISWGARRTVPG